MVFRAFAHRACIRYTAFVSEKQSRAQQTPTTTRGKKLRAS